MALFWLNAVLVQLVALLLFGRETLVGALPCLPDGVSNDVTIGDSTYVCLVLNNLDWNEGAESGGQYAQVVIKPDADEFSRIKLEDSWTTDSGGLVDSFGPQIAFHVESMGVTSFQKMFRDTTVTNGRTSSLFTAIVFVDEGTVTGITFDDGCHFCGSSSCAENTFNYRGNATVTGGSDCFWDDAACVLGDSGSEASDLCQLTVYVVWTGTDSNGNYFSSAQKRLSAFTSEAVNDYVDDVQSKASSVSVR